MNTLQPSSLFVACLILTLCDGAPLYGADQPRPAAAKSLSLDLRSEYRPVPVRVPTPRDLLEVRSVEIRAQLGEDGSGDGSMRLDTRPATLNPFGDVKSREGAQPEPIPITIRRVTPDEILALRAPFGPDPGLPDWRILHAVEFPGGQVTSTVRLKLGSIESQTHRLLIYTFKNLEHLRMHNGHRLTDGALKHLQGLRHLKHLSLFACSNITHAGVLQLALLSALESLELGRTGVTDQGVALLRERLPNCVINTQP